MKKLIMMLSMLFTFATISAKQFCVKIDCYYTDTTKFIYTVKCVNIEDEINKYLNKGYKLISITPKIINTPHGHGGYTTCYYCIFDDCKD